MRPASFASLTCVSGIMLFALRGIADVPPPIASPKVRDLVAQILDEKIPATKRVELIQQNPKLAAELIGGLTDELTPGTAEEARRIPWIWRIANGAGRGNQLDTLRAVLEEALPEPKQPLDNWRAVVVGGGIINGIGQQGTSPRSRLAEVLKNQTALTLRWNMALDEAVRVAEDPQIPPSTRYDALRMLGLDTWERRGQLVEKYLLQASIPELQMGAANALADMEHPTATAVLMEQVPTFSNKVRHSAIEWLLHSVRHQQRVIEQLEKGTFQRGWLDAQQRETVLKIEDSVWSERAVKVLKIAN